MKVINSGQKFSGTVRVLDKEIYIDTTDGTGFYEIFETMKGIINNRSNYGASLYATSFDDAKQDVCMFILEGILKYKVVENASLSTFLYTFVTNKIIDHSRSKLLRGRTEYVCHYDDASFTVTVESDPSENIDLLERTKEWDNKWKNIMFRIFVLGENINIVASDEDMSAWGLTRALRRKLDEARKV